jgi:hypothetical protein
MRVMRGVAASMATNNTSATANTATAEGSPAGAETEATDRDSKLLKGSDTNIVISSG